MYPTPLSPADLIEKFCALGLEAHTSPDKVSFFNSDNQLVLELKTDATEMLIGIKSYVGTVWVSPGTLRIENENILVISGSLTIKVQP